MRIRPLLIVGSIVLLLTGTITLLALQRSHIERVVAEGLDSRLLPHAVNSSGRLAATLETGRRAMELDLHFVIQGEGGYFEVKHDQHASQPLTLESYLEQMKGRGVKKLWFDIKNLGDENSRTALNELLRLDTHYGIRQYAIIESPFQGSAFHTFRAAGFHTSYYLPIGQIRRLLKAGDEGALRAQAEAIAAQLRRQQPAAVSFHLDIYPFVKHYLEPLIDTQVVYHTWASIRLYYPFALERLQRADYFNDPRVETILYDLLELPVS